MKYIKYIAAALLLVAGLSSCSVFESEGEPGNTTVQFAQAEVNEGFGAGMVRVPLTITADSENAMNSCDVKATLKVVETGDQFEGTPDLDGLSGDFRITSLNVNFPAYDSYYNEKEPDKYKDPETGKYVKTVYVEVMIINDEPEKMVFTLEIDSATTTIGEQKQCIVVLEKTTRDRICGLYNVEYQSRAWVDEEITDDVAETGDFTKAQIVWNSEGYFQILTDHFLTQQFGATFYAWYDAEQEQMYFLAHEILGYLDEAATQWLFHSWWNTNTSAWAEDDVYTVFDADAGTITFPENMAVSLSVFNVDDNHNPTTLLVEMCPAYKGLKFTKAR